MAAPASWWVSLGLPLRLPGPRCWPSTRAVLSAVSVLLWLAGPVLLAAVGALSTAAPAHGQTPPDTSIRPILCERVASHPQTGIVVGLLEADGARRYIACGGSGRSDIALDSLAVFEIGSITKVFTGALLADLAEQGRVALTDPVADYLPDSVRVPARNGRQITLLDLATQRSGLPRLPSNLRPRNALNPYADYSVSQLYLFLSGYTLTRDPGAQFEYSNLGVGLLGLALARAAGTSWPELVRERILAPLQLRMTGVSLTPEMQAHATTGHNALDREVPYWDLPTFAGAGALRSTAADMLRFAAANLDPGDAPLTKTLRLTHQPRADAGSAALQIGLNWLIAHPYSRDIIWHNGGTGGFHAFIGLEPATGRAVVVLANSSRSIDDIGLHVLDPRLPLAGQPATGQ